MIINFDLEYNGCSDDDVFTPAEAEQADPDFFGDGKEWLELGEML